MVLLEPALVRGRTTVVATENRKAIPEISPIQYKSFPEKPLITLTISAIYSTIVLVMCCGLLSCLFAYHLPGHLRPNLLSCSRFLVFVLFVISYFLYFKNPIFRKLELF
jgi:hypothetical protein